MSPHKEELFSITQKKSSLKKVLHCPRQRNRALLPSANGKSFLQDSRFVTAALALLLQTYPFLAYADSKDTLKPGVSDSLWDFLASRAEQPNADIPPPNPFATTEQRRIPLGPIPGFTLPASQTAGSTDDVFGGKTKARGMFGSVGSYFDRLMKASGSKIEASGNSRFSFRSENISGSGDAYRSDQYFGRGNNGVYNDTDVTINATLFKHIQYQTRLSNSPFRNPNDNRVKLDYNTPRLRVEWGDINAGFQGNSLIDFNRYLNGFAVTNKWNSNLRTKFLVSQTKADTRTIVVPGNDSSGPYFVYSGQIVEGSEHVRIDSGGLLEKGKDYQLDPFNGELRFLNNRIIPRSSTIAISYETLGFNQSQGAILGGRVEYKINRNLNAGLTYVSQQSRGTNGLQQRTEELRGFGSPQFYPTDAPIDLTKPLTITVAGRQLGTNEYTVDTSTTFTNRVFINLSIPFDTIIRITYFPYNSNPTPGNRSVIGFDTRYALGALGSISIETALSGLSLSNNNYSGHAWQLRADLNPLRNVHTTVALRNINPTFSSIQSPGFNRNEKALEFSTEYTPSSRLRFGVNYLDSRRPAYAGSQFSVSSVGNDKYRQYGLTANYNLSKTSSLSLSRNNLNTTFALGGNSVNTSDTLALNYAYKTITADVSLSRNLSNVTTSYNLLGLSNGVSNPGDNQFVNNNTSTWSKRIGLGWQASNWLRLSTSFSDNDVANIASGQQRTSTKARDANFSAQMNLLRNLRFGYTFTLSDTGSGNNSTNNNTGNILGNTRQTIGGSTSTGSVLSNNFGSFLGGGANNNLGGLGNFSGYQGNTFNNTYGNSSFGGSNNQHSLRFDYQPTPRLQIGLNMDIGSSAGDYQFNASRDNLGLNVGWQVNNRMQMNLAYGSQRTTYTAGAGGSRSNSFLFSFQGNPFGGKLGVQFNLSLLKTNSAFNFNQSTGTTGTTLTDTSSNLASHGLRVDYPISKRQTLFVEMLSSNTSGFLANTEDDIRFGLDYSLTKTLKFSLGWQILSHNYKDPQNANLNYRVSSLLAELGLHF